MRRKKITMLPFTFHNKGLPKIVAAYRQDYNAISRILDGHPEILHLAHKDLATLSQESQQGRSGDFTSETLLRALVVHAHEGLSLRETVIRIADSDFLQDFIRTHKKAVMDFTFLDRCLKALQPSTLKKINDLLAQSAAAQGLVDTTVVRADTTAVETNIHWPTDASLLWDTYRVATRLLRQGRQILPNSCPHRFHDKKIKKLYLFITRFSASNSKSRQRKVKTTFRILIRRVEKVVEAAEKFCKEHMQSNDIDQAIVAHELAGFLPPMIKVVSQSCRAKLAGETVPAKDRVFSIFEPHTELIKRGRREKPVEFGHMLLLCQSPEKFITDYEVLPQRVPDCRLTDKVVDRHKRLFEKNPRVLAADKGFCPAEKEYMQLKGRLEVLAIPRRLRDFVDAALVGWQSFRAGIEGTISALKRAFRLSRCMYRGFKTFAASVGLGIFTHNLFVLAKSKGV